jgi:hypothetical protein
MGDATGRAEVQMVMRTPMYIFYDAARKCDDASRLVRKILIARSLKVRRLGSFRSW